jgi:hypothetical protein
LVKTNWWKQDSRILSLIWWTHNSSRFWQWLVCYDNVCWLIESQSLDAKFALSHSQNS